jgi:hypothetical protein
MKVNDSLKEIYKDFSTHRKGNSETRWLNERIAALAKVGIDGYDEAPVGRTGMEFACVMYLFTICFIETNSLVRLYNFLKEERQRMLSEITIKEVYNEFEGKEAGSGV